MSSSKVDAVDSPYRPKVELQGPHPAPLMIQNQSHKISKSPKKPLIIYMVSPKVIHAEASEFMALVQHLTGLSSSSSLVKAESSGGCQSSNSRGKKGSKQQPVKVKARALNHMNSDFVKSTQQPCISSPMSPTLFLHDLNPLSCQGNQKQGPAASQSWFVNEDYMCQGP